MKTQTALIILTLCGLLFPAIVLANNDERCDCRSAQRIDFYGTAPSVYTLPSPVKPVEAPTATRTIATQGTAVVKKVPKARKVTVPRPVTVKVNPVKVVKPRIIKPVLKVL